MKNRRAGVVHDRAVSLDQGSESRSTGQEAKTERQTWLDGVLETGRRSAR